MTHLPTTISAAFVSIILFDTKGRLNDLSVGQGGKAGDERKNQIPNKQDDKSREGKGREKSPRTMRWWWFSIKRRWCESRPPDQLHEVPHCLAWDPGERDP